MKNIRILFVLLLLVACGSKSKEDTSQLRRVPDFTLQDMDGELVSLSQYNDKTVLLVFWATWCPHCRAEIPRLKEIHEQYNNRDLVILALSVDNNPEKLKEFVNDNNISYKVLFDKGTETAQQYGVLGIPAHFIVDIDGNGYFFGADIDAAMEKAEILLKN